MFDSAGDGVQLDAPEEDRSLAAEWARERQLGWLNSALITAALLVTPLMRVFGQGNDRKFGPLLLGVVGALVSVVLGIHTRVVLDRRVRSERTLAQPHAPARPFAVQEREQILGVLTSTVGSAIRAVIACSVALALAAAIVGSPHLRGMQALAATAIMIGLVALVGGGLAATVAIRVRRESGRVRAAHAVGFVRGAYFAPRQGADYIGGLRVQLPVPSALARPELGERVEAAIVPAFEENSSPAVPRRVLGVRTLGPDERAALSAPPAQTASASRRWLPAVVGGGFGLLVVAATLFLYSTLAPDADARVSTVPPGAMSDPPADPDSPGLAGNASAIVPDTVRGDSARSGSVLATPSTDDDLVAACDSVAALPSPQSSALVRAACLASRGRSNAARQPHSGMRPESRQPAVSHSTH